MLRLFSAPRPPRAEPSGVELSEREPEDAHELEEAGRRPRRRAFSPLTSRILAVNLLALLILVGGVLYLDQFRAGLVRSRVAALKTEGEIIAGALAEVATTGPDATGVRTAPATQIIRRLIAATRTRARLFSTAGDLIADSRSLLAAREMEIVPLPPPTLANRARARVSVATNWLGDRISGREALPPYVERPDQRATDYIEVMRALEGYPANVIRERETHELVISIAIPVQRFHRVLGALLLTTETGDIEAAVRAQRRAIVTVMVVAFAVTALLSLFLARTIARPIIRLAEAAERIRMGRGRRVAIPDLSPRNDEIGDLSAAMQDMTQDLYARIDAIDNFAADVAHELKNPLTSLRSAAETAARATDADARARLIEIMLNDVNRLDRLITDISQASRLDAELLRAEATTADLLRLIRSMVEGYRATMGGKGPSIDYSPADDRPLVARCIEPRIGQVLRNLLDNAISFSPPGGRIAIRSRRAGSFVVITVEDEGPGIPPGKLEEIFSRFYTERPEDEHFGAHSGLGLSISKQIVQAHGGRISAENLYPPGEAASLEAETKPIGARFTVLLPADPPWASLRR